MERTQRKQHLVTVMNGTKGGVTDPSVAQRTAGPPDWDRDRLRSPVVPERDGLCSSQAGKGQLSATDHVFVQKVVVPALSRDETAHSDHKRGPLGGEASPSGAGEHVTLSRECTD